MTAATWARWESFWQVNVLVAKFHGALPTDQQTGAHRHYGGILWMA